MNVDGWKFLTLIQSHALCVTIEETNFHKCDAPCIFPRVSYTNQIKHMQSYCFALERF
jgi:hypothetical protein